MLTKIKDWILGGLAVIGGVFGAIFYVLFQQKKAEEQAIKEAYNHLENENKANEKIRHAQDESVKKGKEEQKKNEQTQQTANGNNLDAFNACNQLLQNHRD